MLLETIMKRLKKAKGMPNPETCSKCKKEVFCYVSNIYFKKWCKITCFECYNKKEKARIKYKDFDSYSGEQSELPAVKAGSKKGSDVIRCVERPEPTSANSKPL